MIALYIIGGILVLLALLLLLRVTLTVEYCGGVFITLKVGFLHFSGKRTGRGEEEVPQAPDESEERKKKQFFPHERCIKSKRSKRIIEEQKTCSRNKFDNRILKAYMTFAISAFSAQYKIGKNRNIIPWHNFCTALRTF